MRRRSVGFLFCSLFISFFVVVFLSTTNRRVDDLILWYKRRNFNDTNQWRNFQFWQKLTAETTPYYQCTVSACKTVINPNQTLLLAPKDASHSQNSCPFYFRYIYEDLAPWADGGITKKLLDKAKPLASFRVVIKRGKLYVEPYAACFQTRALFSIWGLLQLIEFYPGLVPDVDMLFGCEDTPKVRKRTFIYRPQPLPVFRYCTDMNSFDIPFPDWSFWGWPELHIKTWDKELKDILKENNAMIWEKRKATAFWRGNTNTSGKLRKDLQRCNAAKYSAEIFHQNWNNETNMRSEESRLAKQCKHRYKLYVEGWGWSVSLKYILACDSPVFLLSPNYYDFFSRGLTPMKHYWPIRTKKLCRSIKFATDWGNNNTVEAKAMGKAGNDFIRKELSMKHVYDYMLHLLLEYAKMLQFEPTPGEFARQMCNESFMCQARTHKEKSVYEDSMVKSRSKSSPCFLPPRDKNLIEASVQQHLDINRIVAEAEDRGSFTQY